MKTQWIKEKMAYTGHELHHLFAYEKLKISGDSVVAWVGPCEIALSEMVDGEDQVENAEIRGDLMLHFIAEIFQPNIFFAVSFQRLFTCICLEELQNLNPKLRGQLLRSGDDIYFQKKKLSISIASIGAFSMMMHFAVNITNDGTPVRTCCLQDFQINPNVLAKNMLQKIQEEYDSIVFATQKVHAIGSAKHKVNSTQKTKTRP